MKEEPGDTAAVIKRLDRIEDLPTLPQIALEVNRMLQSNDISTGQLSAVLEKDQSMVSKILRLVNSAFFGLRSKVNNIHHAITLLGFNTVRNAVLSVSMVKAFPAKNRGLNGFDLRDFWRHSVAVAVTGKHLGAMSRLCPPDDCFVAGLLHDIGKVVLACYFRDLFDRVWVAAERDHISFYEAEKKELPMDHAKIGSRLGKKWQLPENLVEVIRYHHAENPSCRDPNLMKIVCAADRIVGAGSCEGLDPESGCPKMNSVPAPFAANLSEWYPAVLTEIDSACRFFMEGG